MAISHKIDEVFTYSDYLKWPDDERWEIIEGRPYSMTPAPGSRHQEISGELFFQIKSFLKGDKCKVYAALFDVRLPVKGSEDNEITTVVQPDISVICDKSKIDEKGCLGPPDIIFEIISPNTASKDKIEKFNIYEKAGVKEYWIVHPADRTIARYLLGENLKYGRPDIYSDNEKAASLALEGLEIDFSIISLYTSD